MAIHLFIAALGLTSPLMAAALYDIGPNAPPYPYEAEGKTSPQYSDAQAEAIYWITLLDQLQFGPSWEEAGPLLKDIVSRDQWVAAMDAMRRPLGVQTARKVDGHRVLAVLPFGTKGYFMEITYSTSFRYMMSSREIITLMWDERERWRVISYRIG